jgi:hypothetical protein
MMSFLEVRRYGPLDAVGGGLICAEGRPCVMDAGSGPPSITERRVADPAATPRRLEVEMLTSLIGWWLASIVFLAIWVMIETSPESALHAVKSSKPKEK